MGNNQSDVRLIPHNGEVLECNRVTSVLGATKASAGLSTWYGKEERKGIQAIATWLPTEAMLLEDPRQFKGVEEIRTAICSLTLDDDDDLFASRKRDDKAGAGTTIHELINLDALRVKAPANFQCTEDEWRRFMLWDTLRLEKEIEYVESEKTVYSPNLLVSGSLDLIVRWNGRLWLLDTKTGKLRRDAATQAAIYWVLRMETKAIEEKDLAAQEAFRLAYSQGTLPKLDWPSLGVLHIDDDKIEIYEIDPALHEDLAKNFLYRLQIFRQDKTLRPFRRLYPEPKVFKNGKTQEVKWLRAM